MRFFKSFLSTSLIALFAMFISMGVAHAGSLVFTSALAPETGQTGVSSSGTTVTIESDQLANSTDNIIKFVGTATVVGSGYIHYNTTLVSTAPKQTSAAAPTIATIGNDLTATYSLPVDQVAFGSPAVTLP